MTGSGKTGLGVVVIEECLAAGVPTILIDPKGDLTNLCLIFPELRGTDFRPWVNESDAQKAGLDMDAFAEQQAGAWKDGLGGWGITPERLAELRSKVEFTIYTPGSSAGRPVNIVGDLTAPPGDTDPEVVSDEIDGYVTSVLGMLGISGDPLSSREHILLANLIQNAWSQGQSLDLGTLLAQVQQPPMRKLGVLELDAFFPPNDRMAFAMKLNGLLASPSFAAWLTGDPIDIDAMLRTPEGKPRCAIISTAHLSDEQRQSVTSLVLSKLVTWMRRQSGTSDLRALLYMDEVAGYLPPTANPPTKKPIMLLLKQARAFGLGVVLSTQNPVDVDYKALSNAGTWLIGRLQTEQDKARLVDGLSSASGAVDIKVVSDTISNLGKRQFLLKRVGKDVARGDDDALGDELPARPAHPRPDRPGDGDRARLPPPAAPPAPAAPAAAAPQQRRPRHRPLPRRRGRTAGSRTGRTSPPPAPPAAAAAAPPPVVGATLPPATAGADESPVMPALAAGVPVSYVDPAAPWLPSVGGVPGGQHLRAAAVARVDLTFDEGTEVVATEEYEAILMPLTQVPDPRLFVNVDYDDRDFVPAAPAGVVYGLVPPEAKAKTYWTSLQKSLVAELVRAKTTEVMVNTDLKADAAPGRDPRAVRRALPHARRHRGRQADDRAAHQVRVEADHREGQGDRRADQRAGAAAGVRRQLRPRRHRHLGARQPARRPPQPLVDGGRRASSVRGEREGGCGGAEGAAGGPGRGRARAGAAAGDPRARRRVEREGREHHHEVHPAGEGRRHRPRLPRGLDPRRLTATPARRRTSTRRYPAICRPGIRQGEVRPGGHALEGLGDFEAAGLVVGLALGLGQPSPEATGTGLASAASTVFCGDTALNFVPSTRSTVVSVRLSSTSVAPGT